MTRVSKGRLALWILGATCALSWLVVWAGLQLIERTRQSTLDDAQREIVQFTEGARAALNRRLLIVDGSLYLLGTELGMAPSELPAAARADLVTRMRNIVLQDSLIDFMVVLDAQGRVELSSDGRLEGHSYLPPAFLKSLLDAPYTSMTLGETVRSPLSGLPVLHLARTVRLADGSTRVLAVEMRTRELTVVLLHGVHVSGLTMSIRHGDRTLLDIPPMDAPTQGRALGDERPSTGAAGDDPALRSTRALLMSDYEVHSWRDQASALADWQGTRTTIRAVAGLLAATVLVLGFLYWNYAERLRSTRTELIRSRATLDDALGSLLTGILVLDHELRLLSWNSRFVTLFPFHASLLRPLLPYRTLLLHGLRHAEADGDEAAHRERADGLIAVMRQGHRQGDFHFGERVVQVASRHTSEGGYVITYEDVTALRQAMQDVEKLAFYDPLTGLPNRRLLSDRLEHAARHTQRDGQFAALVFMDLDHFKKINDTLGHATGDELLRWVARQLSLSVRRSDTVARLGGDEFVLLLERLPASQEQAMQDTRKVLDQVVARMREPCVVGDDSIHTGASLGAVLFSGQQHSAADLMQQADVAMYQAKTGGRNRWCFFDASMLAAVRERVQLESDLRQAVAQEQLELHYQAQVDVDGRAAGVEALLRWRHPERGLLQPEAFIAVAEETGQMYHIGNWVLRQACDQLALWKDDPQRRHLDLSVNLSRSQFRHPGFTDALQQLLQESGAPPQRLQLEMSESLLLEDVQATLRRMRVLEAIGVRLGVDDFGTGNTSLSWLGRMPLNQLKIDQSFVHNISGSASEANIAATIVGLGRMLGLEVVAAGVETADQRDFLDRHGCVLYQGHLFSGPVPLAELGGTIRA